MHFMRLLFADRLSGACGSMTVRLGAAFMRVAFLLRNAGGDQGRPVRLAYTTRMAAALSGATVDQLRRWRSPVGPTGLSAYGRVVEPDVPLPAAEVLESELIPTSDRIVKAVETILDRKGPR
jgi:hypothetical protein